MAGPLTLSMKELDRLQVLTRIAERRLTRRRAAGLLQIGERQVRRLYRAFVQDGAAGLVSRRRGRPSARRLPAATQERALALIRERYADFGPTFAHQKLTEEHALVLSVETLRGWMSAAGLWSPRAQRARRSYPPRERRACLGELVQLDGSEHAWFEDRGPRCTLLVYVDDATSRLMELCFADTESTFDYFHATRRYLERHGKPMAFYSDRLSVFHVQARDRAQGGPGLSQFGRVLRDLNIDSLCANSPQEKGGGEPADGTVTIRGNGRVLAYRLHPRDHAQLVLGVVVEHKHLDGVFAWIAAQQHDRDAARLANPKVTLRAKKRLRAAASSSASSADP